jgi:hypothetical protein
VLAAALLGLAGCGGAERAAEPRLAHRDAAELVTRAQQIERDAPVDGCAATREITALAGRAQALVAAGRVPLRLRAPLLRGIDGLVADAPACAPPPPPAAPSPAHPADRHGKGHDNHKDHGHGHGNDQGD